MKRKTVILLHIGAWSLLLASDLFSYHPPPKSVSQGGYTFFSFIIIHACYLLIPIFCFYSAYALVAPQLFVSRRNVIAFIKAFIYFLASVAGAVILRYSMEYYFFKPFFGFDNYGGHPWPMYDFIRNVFFFYFPKYFIYGIMYFFAENWYRTRHLQQQLEKEKTAAELAFLRSQLNPHFLFNTINDIYSLSYQKSDLAPGALLKISAMLRYMLRESRQEMMPLNQEINYLENLVELQQISAKGQIYVDFDVEGLVGQQMIASLVLVSFVENVFKHGVLNEPANPASIQIRSWPEKLSFSSRNKKNNYQKDKTGGIGLSNVKRRLDLIYPGKHKLNIQDDPLSYHVDLTLELS
ncbi:MAG TPA: histidine kinase [Puia sp.]|nr:histidine kinase [Puia sp.]